ncbi:hypothetical protein ABH942_000874 [Flavobacterium sp. 28YEA47A]|uniref:Ig-like domain-containing protein n=1 Tax=Flavobacterium sp. 28YEA47A TaxID=3156276 RepID=UPI00351862A2
MFRIRFAFLYIILALSVISCAKRGSITGGLKDTLPPVMRSSVPKNFSTNFNVQEIKITFDEYVKIKDVNKQLIISPPMKNPPIVSPSNASKYITIKIKDTLLPNTTYSFNFGSSIQDNNEGNPYQQFKYVFSTGNAIDSLSIGGFIKDAYTKNVDNFVSIMLYEVNETFTDSIIYKQNPRYVTNTLDSLKTFKLENLKEGKYLLIALKDQNNNFKFNPKTDKIAFHKEFVKIPSDTLYEMELFKEIIPFKATKPYQASGNRIIVPYEGDGKNAVVTLKNNGENLPVKISKFPKKDSLQVWFSPIKTDSLLLKIDKDKFSKEFTVKIKNQKKDTLSFQAVQSNTLHFRDRFTINASMPLVAVDKSKISLVNKDSIAVPFTTEYDEFHQEIKIDFEKEPLETYKITAFPGAFTNYIQQANDTLNYRLKTQNISEYGNLRIRLQNVKHYPVIIEITNSKGDLIASEYSEGKDIIDFMGLQPNLFTLRVIYDENKNKIWDTGSYLEKRQPEEVVYYPTAIDVRANWDVDQTVNLGN